MVRVDHGTEHCLMLFVQEYLKDQRGNLSCEPYVQTRSREVSYGFKNTKNIGTVDTAAVQFTTSHASQFRSAEVSGRSLFSSQSSPALKRLEEQLSTFLNRFERVSARVLLFLL